MQEEMYQIHYEDQFLRCIEEKIRSNQKNHWAVGILQIKNYYLYQDMYGRVGTEQIINQFRERLHLFHQADGFPVAYFGQDNFYLMFPNDIVVIQRIYDAFIQILPYKQTDEIHFYPIMGICSFDNVDNSNADALAVCNYAKVACAKANEKDEFIRLFSKKSVNQMVAIQRNVEAIRKGIINHEFMFYLQPKVNSATNIIVGMEALMRWNHPTKGILTPSSFMPIAEGTSLVKELDCYIWESVCQMLSRWKKEKRNVVPVSINVSQEDINHMSVSDKLIELVDKYDIDPKWLAVEITETSVVHNEAYIKKLLHNLHEKGINVIMDDFGSGASSLGMLEDIPVDAVKLDMKLIQLDANNLDRGIMILNSIVNMIHTLNVPIVAEGVETKEQVAMLQSINCKYVQGFYYYKPMSIESVEMIMMRPGVPMYFDIQTDYSTSSQLYGTKFINTEVYQALRLFNMYTDYFISMGILNLKTGEYALVKHNKEAYGAYTDQIIDFKKFCSILLDEGIIHPEFINIFKAKTDLNHLRSRFYYEKKGETFNILEKINDEYEWIRSTLIPCKDCSEKNPWAFNMVTYGESVKADFSKLTQYDYITDTLTKIYNRNKYEYDIKKFQDCSFRSLVCTYIDVIGLHEVNYYEGHESGDALLQMVAFQAKEIFYESFVYRVGGDEFVILSANSTLDEQLEKVANLVTNLEKHHYYISHGSYASTNMHDIHTIINTAEEAMRKSKQDFYNNTAKNEERARLLNAELENTLDENKTLRLLLNSIRRHYYGIYLVNINENMVKCISTKVGLKQLFGTEKINYRNMMNYFILNYVKENETFKIRRLLDPIYLNSQFKMKGYAATEFNTKSGKHFSLLISEVEGDKDYTVWCFSEEKIFSD